MSLEEKKFENTSQEAEALKVKDLELESQSQSGSEYHDPARDYVDEWNPNGLVSATEADKKNYRKILGHAPIVAYLMCLVEFAERASYYGVQGCLQNFIQRPLPVGGNGAGAPPKSNPNASAGALDMGLAASSAITLLLTFLAYVMPLIGGYISDTRYGKMKCVWAGTLVGGVAHIILVIAAIPSVITGGHALAPTVIAIIVLACGTGLIKPNLLPLLMEQYPYEHDVLKVLPSGETVIVDRESTLERMTLVFYWAINIGAFLQLATSYCERRVGFWLAYLIPGIAYIIVPIVLIFVAPRIHTVAPKGSLFDDVFKVFRVSYRGGWVKRLNTGEFWEYAKPSAMYARGEQYYVANKENIISWNDQFVADIKQTVDACKIFLYFIIFNLNDGGIGGTQTSQAGAMSTNGVPNDLFNNFNPLTIIILIPILDRIVYPAFRKFGITFRPVWRIAFGFVIAALGSMVCAILQWRIYKTSPCGYQATNCSEAGTAFSPISAWAEVSVYILQAAGECFSNVTAYEIAFTRAPDNMRGLVMALFLFTTSISAAINEACSAALIDPYLIWPSAAIAIAGVISAIAFLYQFRNLHHVMAVEQEEKDARKALKDKTGTGLGLTAIESQVRSVQDFRK